MKTSLFLLRNKLSKTAIAVKLFVMLTFVVCFSNSLYASGKPAAKHSKKEVPASAKVKHKPIQAVPSISYTTPHNYMGTVAITTLSPTSSGVAALAYNLPAVNAGSGFNGPRGMAADAAGNVYVADFTNNQVKKIPAGGGSPIVIGSGFSSPVAVAVDAAGNVYVSDIGTNTVKKVPVGGGATVVIGMGFSNVYSLACDAAGNVYLADSGNGALKMIPAAGGNPVIIATGYKSIISVGVDGFGNVYTGDSMDQVVYKFPAGSTVPTVFAPGFETPAAISSDGEGNIYIIDANANFIKKYPVGGGAPTTLNVTISLATGLTVDGSGSVYAADYYGNQVKKIDPAGGYFINKTLPKGLKFNGTTGNITGTPAKASPATDYTVTAYNSFGGSSAIVNIKVTPLTFSYNNPPTYTAGVGITPLSPSSSGVGAPSYDNVPVTISNAFGGPRGLTFDAAGNFYVADYTGNVVKKIPVGGGAAVTIGSGFIHPTGVAVDAAGNVFVTDISSTNVMKILAGGGAPVVVATGFSNPLGIAIDAKGNLYVADYGNKVIKMIPVGGVPVIVGSGFTSLVSVAVDAAGNIYAGDSGTHAVYKIPADGSAMVQVGTGPNSPNGIAVDGAGNIFVSDGTNNVVNKFPVGGGAPVLIGSGPGTMIGVVVDSAGVLYVTDFSNKALQKITPAGGYHISPALPTGLNFDETTGTISGTPTSVSPATDYTVTAYNTSGSAQAIVNMKVKVLDISYSSPKTYITATPIAPLAPASAGVAAVGYTNSPVTLGSGFNRPRGVAVDAAGNIYIADFQTNTVKKMPAGGGIPVLIGSGFSGPSGVALDAAGNVYVADYTSSSVKKIPAGGGATVVIGSGFLHPTGVAADAAGNVFVADNGNHAMKEIPAGGGAVINLGSYTDPLGVATDVAGNVYFSEKSNGVIYKIPAVGGPATIIASGFTSPLGLTVDVSGNLFVADGTITTLLELPATSNTLVPISAGFNIPAGVAFDAAGNLYVADYLNNAIKKIKPVGGYYINALPAGLNFDNATGTLSGTPTLVSPATDYTVTAYNSFGSNHATINIKVDLLPLPVMSYPLPPIYVVNTPIPPFVPQSTGVAPPGYTNAPVNLGSGYNNPVGIAVASTGEVFIADAGNHAVKLIYENNNNVFTIGSGLNNPSGVATDASGNVYVTDQLNNSLRRIAMPANTTTTVATGFNNPCGVAVDAAGNIYVADRDNNVVKKIPFGGGATIVIGSGFNQPSGVAVDNTGNVYVADFGNNAIKMIPAGVGSPVTLGSGFSQPTGIAVDASGNIYIADTGNNAIEKMPAGGGVPVVICTAIIHPRSVAVGYNGIVYATDNVGNKVKIIKPVGGYYAGPVLPPGIIINNTTGVISGTPLTVVSYMNYEVTAYNNSGSVATSEHAQVNLLPPPFVGYSSPQSYTKNIAITPLISASSAVSIAAYSSATTSIGTNLALPVGVAVDAAGNVYVADSGSGLVKKIQKVGGGTMSIGSGFNTPSGVAVDGAANVYVSDSGSNLVYKIPANGGATLTIGNGFSSPSAVAVDSLGNVYVTDKGNHALKKIPAGGGAIVTVLSGLKNPSGVAADANGNIYVTDGTDNVVRKVPAGGGSAAIVASGFSQALGVAIDASGNLFVSSYNNSTVNMLPSGGGAMTVVGSGFNHAYGIAIDASGTVYIADYLNNIIKKSIPVGGFYIQPALPAGLIFNSDNGVISGTPTAVSAPVDYLITGYNIYGSATGTVNIAVNLLPPPTVSYSTPQVYLTGAAIAPLTPTSSGVSAPSFSNTSYTVKSGGTPAAVATDAAGNVYIADRATNTVKEIPANGGPGVTLASGFNFISAVAVDAAGNVYVGDYQAPSLTMIPVGGGAPVSVGSGFINASGIAFDAAGNIFVADASTNAIYKIPVGGGPQVTFAAFTGYPSGISFDAAGNLYFASTSLNVIKMIPADGSPAVVIGTGFNQPNGVAVDNVGNVFVADFNSTVKMIPAGGGAPVVVSSGYTHPFGVALDASGNFYIADISGKVKKVTRTGGYYINPALPIGLTLNNNTGIINGTPLIVSPPQNFTASAYNGSGSASATINIAVNVGPADATLSKLAVSAGSFTPVFNYAQISYVVSVPNATSTIKITPTSTNAAATIKVNGAAVASGTASANIALATGVNTIAVVVKSKDGTTTKTYTLKITRALSSNAVLTLLKLTPSTPLVIVSGPDYRNYTSNIPNSETSFQVTATAQDTTATIFVNGLKVQSGVASQVLFPDVGDNGVYVTVTAQDGLTIKNYTINVTRAASSIATLDDLYLNTGTLSPNFAAATTSYAVSLPNTVTTVNVTPQRTNSGAVVKVNGVLVAYGYSSADIPLAGGLNTITTVVTSGDGTATKTYTINVTRAQSPNALLTSIKTTPASSLATVSGPDYRDYTTNVPNSQTSLQITPTAQDATATITVNGVTVASGTLSQVIQLNTGSNVINTVVTAQDGTTTKTYGITVTRAPSAIATLADLTLSSGSLSPAFAAATTNYIASVANTVTTINVTPTATDAGAVIKVNGTLVSSGAASAAISLVAGLNTVTVGVTSQDGTSAKSYTVQVTRALSSNSILSAIKTTPASSLLTVSGPDYRDYTTNVPNSVTSLQVTATAQDASATITVNGVFVASGTASQAIPLNVGSNVINTVVTAQDGSSTKTYAITVTRAQSAIATLSALTLGSGGLSPAFATGTAGYTANVPYLTTTMTVTATTTNSGAVIKVNGTLVNSGTPSPAIALVVGSNTITIAVTSQDGTSTKSYTVDITRAKSTNSVLSSLKVTPVTSLTVVAGADYRDYTTSVPNSETSLQVTATAQDATATITVNGIAVASGTASQVIPLSIGSNVISTVVTAQDGVTIKSYVITATRATGPLSMVQTYENADSVKSTGNDIVVHQALSPNGDGIGDVLTIDGISSYPDNTFQVMSRSGALVYRVKGYDNVSRVFAGQSNINSRLLPAGTYFYQLDYNDKGRQVRKTGFVLLKY